MSPEDVQLYYQIVLTARKDLPYADDEQAAFDMMLLRLLAFKPVVNNNNLPEAGKEISDEVSLTDSSLLAHTSANINEDKSIPDAGIAPDHELEVNDVLAEEMWAIEHQAHTLIEPISAESILESEHSNNDQNITEQNLTANHVDEDETVVSTTNNSSDLQLARNDKKVFESPVAAAIATRNMLRSRKKSMEDSGKKSNGAALRPSSTIRENARVDTVKNTAVEQPNIPELATLPEQPYNEGVINPATIKLANQVDKWAHMIDSMSLLARLRQLAIHATIDNRSTDDLLILQLDQSIKHLNSDTAHKQLEAQISEYLQRKITVELNIVEKTVSDPYQIQADINAKRYEYAKQVLAEDEIVIALQEQFQAKLDQETVVAR
jgi:DNA polymerase-3 subunit gamma/tau